LTASMMSVISLSHAFLPPPYPTSAALSSSRWLRSSSNAQILQMWAPHAAEPSSSRREWIKQNSAGAALVAVPLLLVRGADAAEGEDVKLFTDVEPFVEEVLQARTAFSRIQPFIDDKDYTSVRSLLRAGAMSSPRVSVFRIIKRLKGDDKKALEAAYGDWKSAIDAFDKKCTEGERYGLEGDSEREWRRMWSELRTKFDTMVVALPFREDVENRLAARQTGGR